MAETVNVQFVHTGSSLDIDFICQTLEIRLLLCLVLFTVTCFLLILRCFLNYTGKQQGFVSFRVVCFQCERESRSKSCLMYQLHSYV